jgi:hypothetical protein
MFDIQIGDRILFNSLGHSIVTDGIKFFTKNEYKKQSGESWPLSHYGQCIGDAFGEPYIVDVREAVTMKPWRKYVDSPDYKYEVYRLNGVTQKQIQDVTKSMIEDYLDTTYNYFALAYWPWKSLCSTVGVHLNNQHNPFCSSKLIVCSEYGYQDLGRYKDTELNNALRNWNSHCFAPTDAKWMFTRMLPHRFELVFEKT